MHGLTNCGSWGQIPQHALENVRLKLLITLEKRLWGSLPTVRRILNGYQKRYKEIDQFVLITMAFNPPGKRLADLATIMNTANEANFLYIHGSEQVMTG
jgi:hypothetical protein